MIAIPAKALDAVTTVLKTALISIVVIWILNIPGRLNIPLFTEQMLVAVLGIALALTFLMFPLGSGTVGEEAVASKALGEKQDTRAGLIDIVLALAAIVSCFYVAARYPELIKELTTRPWYGVLVASVIVLLVFEASRRVTGLALVIIVLALCAHALLGWMLPEQFASRPVAVSRLMVYLGIDTNALLGNTLQIAIVVVIPFIIMGQVLARCGGSDFFADLAASLMGHFRGGAAKIAVVGSAFFGMISGSAVANVASVGTITIPLMKRAGYPGHIAAGVEAVGSTGGQICPPVMGAAAFLMAEYLQLPYADVMVAAIIPAFLFYAALFIQVDLEAAKLGIVGMPRDTPPLGLAGAARRLALCHSVCGAGRRAAVVESGSRVRRPACHPVLIVLAMTVKHKGRRLTLRDTASAVVGAGGAVVDIIAITAIAGILIGAMTITGVAFSLTQQLLTASGGIARLASDPDRHRLLHPRAAAADGGRLRDPGDAGCTGPHPGRTDADAGTHVRAVQRHSRHGDAAGRTRLLCRRHHCAIRSMADRMDLDASELVRLFHSFHVRLFGAPADAG